MNRKLKLVSEDGDVDYHSAFLDSDQSDKAFAELHAETPWREDEIVLFGKKVMQPRLFSWHADSGVEYKYSGLRLQPQPWSPLLIALKEQVESVTDWKFNSVLLNLYRHERDSNGWHSDDEKELGREPVIASVSLGQSRDFLMKHKFKKRQNVKIHLESGSLLVMRGETQRNWKHTLPKRSRALDPRINLTFRRIFS